MRIAYVTYEDFPESPAVAHRLQMLSRGLTHWGHEVHILAPYRLTPGPLRENQEGVSVHWAALGTRQATPRLGKIAKRFLMVRLLTECLRGGLDWVILYNMGPDGFPLALLARGYDCRVAAETVDIRHYGREFRIRDALEILRSKIGYYIMTPLVQRHLVISSFLERKFRDLASSVPREIIPAPVDLQRFSYQEGPGQVFREKFGLGQGLVVLFLGSHWSVKGGALLLHAFQQLLHKRGDVKLIITGDVEGCTPDDDLRELSRDLHLTDRVIFTGFLSEEEVVAALSAADILVEPKTGDVANYASFPQKLAEYLAMGKPVIAAAVGDIPLYLCSGDNALLYPPGDTGALERAILRLMDDATLRKKLSARSRETAFQFFDCRKLAKKIEAALMS